MTLETAADDLYWRLQDNEWLISVGMGIESIIVYVDIETAPDIPDYFSWCDYPIIVKPTTRPTTNIDWHTN